jgi:hypothetical protein
VWGIGIAAFENEQVRQPSMCHEFSFFYVLVAPLGWGVLRRPVGVHLPEQGAAYRTHHLYYLQGKFASAGGQWHRRPRALIEQKMWNREGPDATRSDIWYLDLMEPKLPFKGVASAEGAH